MFNSGRRIKDIHIKRSFTAPLRGEFTRKRYLFHLMRIKSHLSFGITNSQTYSRACLGAVMKSYLIQGTGGFGCGNMPQTRKFASLFQPATVGIINLCIERKLKVNIEKFY